MARHAHQARERLHDDVVPGSRGALALIAERGERAVHEPRLLGRERRVIEPEAFHQAGTEVLHDHVAREREPARDRASILGPEVDHDRALVPVEREEVGRVLADERRSPATRVVPGAGSLDLHDVGAEVAEQHRRERARQDAGEVRHSDPGEGETLGVGARSGTKGLLDEVERKRRRRNPRVPAAPCAFHHHPALGGQIGAAILSLFLGRRRSRQVVCARRTRSGTSGRNAARLRP